MVLHNNMKQLVAGQIVLLNGMNLLVARQIVLHNDMNQLVSRHIVLHSGRNGATLSASDCFTIRGAVAVYESLANRFFCQKLRLSKLQH